MNLQEKYALYVEDLFQGVDAGDFSGGEIPAKYTFEYLAALFMYADQLDGGRAFYKQLYQYVTQKAIIKVQEKISRGEKIKITFLAISAAEWPANDLYWLLDKSDLFDVSVTISPLVDRNDDDRKRTYLQNKKFFVEQGYRVLDNYDVNTDRVSTFEEMNEIPDIVIHVSYWYQSWPECYRITQYPLDRLNFYISYGFATGNSATGSFTKNCEYNFDFFSMVTKVYANSTIDLREYRKYQLLEGENVEYSGYSKMDYFYDKKPYTDEEICKIWNMPNADSIKGKKRIIIAPHHSFLGYAGIKFSTFGWNVYFWQYLAEKYKDSIVFAFKPHPNLRYRAVEAKIFESSEEYDKYLERWNSLPNTTIIDENSYLDLFATSDAMLTDSISFIAEYLYVNQPMLYLTRKEQCYSELGEECMKAHSKAEGRDFFEIERFVQQVVLKEKDEQKEVRNKVFKDILDYQNDNGCLATPYIYRSIMSVLGLETEN